MHIFVFANVYRNRVHRCRKLGFERNQRNQRKGRAKLVYLWCFYEWYKRRIKRWCTYAQRQLVSSVTFLSFCRVRTHNERTFNSWHRVPSVDGKYQLLLCSLSCCYAIFYPISATWPHGHIDRKETISMRWMISPNWKIITTTRTIIANYPRFFYSFATRKYIKSLF